MHQIALQFCNVMPVWRIHEGELSLNIWDTHSDNRI